MQAAPPSPALPVPTPELQAHAAAVTAHIRDEIARSGGRITFARFMELALYAPGLGYYSAGMRKFGRDGDFVTAPELSPLFSRCLARQCAQVLAATGGNVLEFGAGTGVMAADMLAELEALDVLPERYEILELSAELRQRQGDTLAARVPHLLERVAWLEALPREITGVVVANEVLDAMPVHHVRIAEEGIRELYVAWEGERFAWSEGAPSTAALQAVAATTCAGLPVGYQTEIALTARRWVATLGEALGKGVVLLVDYGFPAREYYHPSRSGGTLMCHYRHRTHPDALILAGLQDITAHVDFTAVAEAALQAGLDVAGYTTQAYFLLASGLQDIVAESDMQNARIHLELTTQVKTLTLPHEMGELFKVMALAKAWDEPLRGFALRDLRARL